jgi:hypothetical protein
LYVDPRVAHGRARYDLGKDPRMFAEHVERQVDDLICSFTRDIKGIPKKRALMRLIDRRIAPALNRMGINTRVIQNGEHPDGMLSSYATRSPEHGIHHNAHFFLVDNYEQRRFPLIRITPHALARCMQRNGVMKLEDIETQTWLALHMAPALRSLAKIEGWQQMGIPVGDGIFVGSFNDRGRLTLSTYFQPMTNGRRSRWAAYKETLGDVPPMNANEARIGDKPKEWVAARVADLLGERPLSERFPFLKEPYEHCEDPLDIRWVAARQAAAADAHSETCPGAGHE